MSVIAVKIEEDCINISSDSIVLINSTKVESNKGSSKLFQVNDLTVGFSGFLEEGILFNIFCSTRRPDSDSILSIINFISEFSDWKRNKTNDHTISNEYIIIFNKKVFICHGFCVDLITNYAAIGAGMDFALATLYLEHSAEDAVKVACALNAYCTLPIQSFKINK